ncbi:dihydrofolate reductase family protein [Amycolatopsis magusensis]|uniref:Dihydrofolate reductase n=1 Tax=Amycolatopsis magusensis TaxID=882444 RepID=A0ABS4PRR3_9PSEU|nr:dihydrofolate reductase family protein [Amycolatopsis magusensis]MBP2182114.1 dihydrofolate reductase [Amycolatopsis magusensis]MDI5977173.1 dihydrofolate reductase family protein [Amycolatopsis magusensis]
MGKLVVTAFTSLDGVMQGPGGPDEDRDGGFSHGGWVVPSMDERVIELMTGVSRRAGALLLGRRTYESFASTWPLAEADDPIGSKLNSMPKYVASRTLTSVGWQNSTLLDGDLDKAVRELKETEPGEIQVHGSAGLTQDLLRHDLVDEFHVLVFPVLLGVGKRLFGEGTIPAGLRLVGSTTMGGVVIVHYARAGGLAYGAMGPETGNW